MYYLLYYKLSLFVLKALKKVKSKFKGKKHDLAELSLLVISI
jgi:hypothetical protein